MKFSPHWTCRAIELVRYIIGRRGFAATTTNKIDIMNNFRIKLNDLSDVIRSRIQSGCELPNQPGSILARFREILAEFGSDDGSIMLQDHWALLHEAEGRIQQAIEHRELEIERIEHLFSIGGPVGTMDHGFLRQTLRSLHRDYLRIEDQEKANEVLRRIEALGR